MTVEMQELVCHCGCVNTFPIKTEKNGNYIIVCKCGHEHCRVVENGVVTGIRYSRIKGRRIFTKSTEQRHTQNRPSEFLSRAWLNLTR